MCHWCCNTGGPCHESTLCAVGLRESNGHWAVTWEALITNICAVGLRESNSHWAVTQEALVTSICAVGLRESNGKNDYFPLTVEVTVIVF